MPVKYWALFYVFKGIGGQNMMNEYRERAAECGVDKHTVSEPVPKSESQKVIHCSRCGKGVSTAVPSDTVIRAWVECPECVISDKPTKEPKEFRL